jgi:hypothetical protein
MRLDVTTNFDQAIAKLGEWQGHIPGVMAQAINDTAFAVRKGLQDELDARLDRVTPYIRNSPFVDQAQPGRLTATVSLAYQGGKGVDPDRVLQPNVHGGPRGFKAAERALQRAGILPNGYQIVPGQGAPLDAYGNMRRGLIVQILSWFSAYGEQGYSANATAATRQRRTKMGRTESGFRTIRGSAYFVAYGALRDGRGSHLAPGIYSKTGIHGVDIKPVVMFVKRTSYTPRVDFYGVGERIAAEAFPRRFRYRYRSALEARAD